MNSINAVLMLILGSALVGAAGMVRNPSAKLAVLALAAALAVLGFFYLYSV